MNTHSLLEVAIGMGFCGHIDTANVYIMQSTDETKRQGCSRKFNPTIGDLMEWLLDFGYFTHIIKAEVSYILFSTASSCSESGVNLKENLLSIVLQVIKAEKEE